jgi:hypothetical protein
MLLNPFRASSAPPPHPDVRGRHAGRASARRRFPVLLSVATALGLWFGISAPGVSPVAPPAPAAAAVAAAQIQPVIRGAVVPSEPQPGVAA